MNYYFMPRFPGLKAAVSLADFTAVDGVIPWPEDMIAHVTWTDGTKWQVRHLGSVVSGQVHRYTEDDLPPDCPSDASPFLFLYRTQLPATLDALPVEHFMDMSPAWRGNIQLFGDTTAVSYQGEYPSFMTNIPRGTLLSFSSFIQNGSGVKTNFILPHLRQSPVIEECAIRFIGATTRKIYKDAIVRTNHTSVVDLSDINPVSGELVLAVSRDITGIPLYLSHMENFTQLSFEHTHPPVELVVFGKRDLYQKKMKSFWLTEAYL